LKVEPKHVALILVDIQRDFWPPFKEHERFSSFPENVSALLEVARSKGLPVAHVRSAFKPDRSDWMLFYKPQGRGDVPAIAGTEGASIEGFASPLPGEHVVVKQTFDAFVGTDLEEYLGSRGVKGVLIAGLETSVCVLFTANSAYLRRIVPLVVSDACADEPRRHDDTLRMYGDLCFKAVTTAQVRNDWPSVSGLVEEFAQG
jgi:nicotinamidase-related amidase